MITPLWYDDWEIKIGDSIVQKINDGISYSDFLIVVLSGNSVSSKWVKEELNAATIKNIESKGAFILPVLLEKCKIPLLLADKKYADFTKSFEKAYNDLDDAIRHHLTLISEALTDGFETDVRKTTADSIEVEASIEENWLNLLEDANEIRIKRFLTRVKADIKSCFFEIVELDGVDTSDSIIHKYYQTIDTVSILILTIGEI
ncbi:toll/interleukin-1 receptor domain-containing protein [candidate division KSB1 bacterium]|nr:toll/interleukin-1 receptor domain-containing protein [candidate division KSB1 bacterium]